jgi:hypothetical protein
LSYSAAFTPQEWQISTHDETQATDIGQVPAATVVRTPAVQGKAAVAIAATALGALAAGALAMGVLAIGKLAIGQLAVGRARLRGGRIVELRIARLSIEDLRVEHVLNGTLVASREDSPQLSEVFLHGAKGGHTLEPIAVAPPELQSWGRG